VAGTIELGREAFTRWAWAEACRDTGGDGAESVRSGPVS
jgi:hypothetical protein